MSWSAAGTAPRRRPRAAAPVQPGCAAGSCCRRPPVAALQDRFFHVSRPHAASDICLGFPAHPAVARAPPQEPAGPDRGHLARGLHERSPRRARGAEHPAAAACLDLERMVQPGQHPRHRDPVLSRAPPPDEAREEDDARRRGRHPGRVHGDSPPRGRPHPAARLPAAAPPALAAAVRPVLATLPALLPAQPRQPEFRPAPAALVRAGPSGRGFRRDVCRLAEAALDLADALCRLAGAQEARICRRADG